MSNLEDRRLGRRSATLTSSDLALVLVWSFGGLLLQLALLAHTAAMIPVWTT
jgi:hypothetical protein